MRVAFFIHTTLLGMVLAWCFASSGMAETVTFQEGDTNGYAGTHDTWFSNRTTGGENNGFPTSSFFRTGLFPPTNQQALVRFDDIFGAGTNQVPLGSQIDNATLTITVDTQQFSDGEANAVHKMLVDWAETDAFEATPWIGGASGLVDTDGVEAAASAVDDSTSYAVSGVIPAGTAMEFDVTSIVQDWSDGDDNYGFLLQSLGLSAGNGLFMDSSESATQSERPLLSIEFSSIAVPESSSLAMFLLVGVIGLVIAALRRRAFTPLGKRR